MSDLAGGTDICQVLVFKFINILSLMFIVHKFLSLVVLTTSSA